MEDVCDKIKGIQNQSIRNFSMEDNRREILARISDIEKSIPLGCGEESSLVSKAAETRSKIGTDFKTLQLEVGRLNIFPAGEENRLTLKEELIRSRELKAEMLKPDTLGLTGFMLEETSVFKSKIIEHEKRPQ